MPASTAVNAELKKLGQHSSHYLVGLIASLLMGFVSFPIFTRVFSVADYGLISLAQKIFVLFAAGSKLGMQNAVLRFYHTRRCATDRNSATEYYTTMFLGTGLAAAIVTALFVAGVDLAPGWMIDSSLGKLLSYGSVLIFLGAIESILWVFLRMEEKTKLFNVVKVVLKGATIIAVCVLLPWAGRAARTYLTGTIAVEGLVVVVFSVSLFKRGLMKPSTFNTQLYRTAIAFSLPLVSYEMAAIVLDSADRLMVRHYLGGDALGYYSVAYGLSQYVNELLILPLNLAIVPIYMKLWASQGAEKTVEFLSVGLDFFFMAAAGIFALAAVSSHDALLFMASAKYQGADRLIPMLVGGLLMFTTHVFLSAGLFIHKDTWTMAKILIVAAAFNIGLNALLLPRIGLVGAALATLLSYLACVILLGWASFRVLPLKLNSAALVKYLFASAAACAAGFAFNPGQPFLNFVGKTALAAVVYIGILHLLDPRVRGVWPYLSGLVRRRSPISSATIEQVTTAR